MKGLKLFTIVILVFTTVTIIVFLVLFNTNILNSIIDSNETQQRVNTIVGFISVILGGAASIGSAIVAIYLSTLGLELSNRMEVKENHRFVEDKIGKLVELYSRIAEQLNYLFGNVVYLEYLLPRDHEHLIKFMQTNSSEEIKFATEAIADNFRDLRLEISKLPTNELAMYCFRLKIDEDRGELKKLSKYMLDNKLTEHEQYVSIEDFAEILGLLSIAEKRMRNSTNLSLAKAKLQVSYFLTEEIKSKTKIDASILSFLLLGSLIFTLDDYNGENFTFLGNAGAAMIHDLINAIPDNKEMKQSIKIKYGTLLKGQSEFQVEFDKKSLLTRGYYNALNSFEKEEKLRYVYQSDTSS